MNTLNWMQSIVMGFVHWTCMPECHTHRTQIFSPTCERKTINWMQSIVLWHGCQNAVRPTGDSAWNNNRNIQNFQSLPTRQYGNSSFSSAENWRGRNFHYCLKPYLKTPSTIQIGRWTFLLPERIREWTKKRSWKHLEATDLSRPMSRTCQSHSSTCPPTV